MTASRINSTGIQNDHQPEVRSTCKLKTSTTQNAAFDHHHSSCLLGCSQPSQSRDQYYGVSVGVITSPGLDPNKVLEPAPIQLYQLTPCFGDDGRGCSISKLVVQNGTTSGGLNINQIQCHRYKDFAGTQPGTTEFNVNRPAMVSTNLATVSSILCYLVPVDEIKY
ncbi:uncharacterized protein LY89DRAFT_160958 [Mollisia scopiformis]|uniref:Uncharacterized protein n=1 Tax=Mollisia scopiformis TaxID=149040 RepID=A0A194X0A3_MOLSC|nr:uncharacterized protein LY89DRAFT_160958 [Mollisia scopiformis]KUJ13625.1 hypothetical protein LY89DRAFT_160958 [Mollisia scopiformis]